MYNRVLQSEQSLPCQPGIRDQQKQDQDDVPGLQLQTPLLQEPWPLQFPPPGHVPAPFQKLMECKLKILRLSCKFCSVN